MSLAVVSTSRGLSPMSERDVYQIEIEIMKCSEILYLQLYSTTAHIFMGGLNNPNLLYCEYTYICLLLQSVLVSLPV